MGQAIMVKKLLSLSFVILLILNCASSMNTKETQEETLKKHEYQYKKIYAAVVAAYQRGNYKEGIQLAEKAYQYAEKFLGKEHPLTLTSINNLAVWYKSRGRYNEAEELYNEALQLSVKVLGQDHQLCSQIY